MLWCWDKFQGFGWLLTKNRKEIHLLMQLSRAFGLLFCKGLWSSKSATESHRTFHSIMQTCHMWQCRNIFWSYSCKVCIIFCGRLQPTLKAFGIGYLIQLAPLLLGQIKSIFKRPGLCGVSFLTLVFSNRAMQCSENQTNGVRSRIQILLLTLLFMI